MILPIVKYGHPALRQKGSRIASVTPELRKLVADMFDTMYDAHGIGLAAQQVGQALQLTVVDVRGIEDRPSTLWLNGEPAAVDDFMPLALINPELTPAGDPVSGPEGCLSFPEMYSDIARPEAVVVRAQTPDGRKLEFKCGGLLAKAIQHEVDHLNGILFIDRMARAAKESFKEELETLMADTKAAIASAAEGSAEEASRARIAKPKRARR